MEFVYVCKIIQFVRFRRKTLSRSNRVTYIFYLGGMGNGTTSGRVINGFRMLTLVWPITIHVKYSQIINFKTLR